MFSYSSLFSIELSDMYSGLQPLFTHNSQCCWFKRPQWSFLLSIDKSYGVLSMFFPQAWLGRSPWGCQSASIAASMLNTWASSNQLPLGSSQSAQPKQAEPQPVSLTHSHLLQGLTLKPSLKNTFSGFIDLSLWHFMCVYLCFCFIKKEPHTYLRFSSTPKFWCSNLTWFEAKLSFENKTCWP